jgi:hypothetical protein
VTGLAAGAKLEEELYPPITQLLEARGLRVWERPRYERAMLEREQQIMLHGAGPVGNGFRLVLTTNPLRFS